jgi:hypothetical protein
MVNRQYSRVVLYISLSKLNGSLRTNSSGTLNLSSWLFVEGAPLLVKSDASHYLMLIAIK